MVCKVLRIGVFFDGTGNNLTNDQAAQKQSNIAKLSQLYAKLSDGKSGDDGCYFIGNKPSECKIITTVIYIEGLGTQENETDNVSGLATGDGGAKRIKSAIHQLDQRIALFPKEEYKYYLDVFGFSRGAALARDFINKIKKDKQKNIKVLVKFVGLFDTVGSFGLAGNDKNYKPITEDGSEAKTILYESAKVIGITLTPPKDEYVSYNFHLSPSSAEKIVHLVALDEYRENFPLSDIEGAGQTYYLIGAHSDVGGGYEPMIEERIVAYSKTQTIDEMRHQLAHPENGVVIGEEWRVKQVDYQEVDPSYEGYKTLSKGSSIRQVSNDLQQIGLMMMYNLAVKEGVPFLPFTLDLSPASLKKITQEVAYTRYNPSLQALHRSSESIASLLGERSLWTDELKAYCIETLENPSFLSSYLGDTTAYFIEEENRYIEPYRKLHHLQILAKYAHNSACSSQYYGLHPPPIGFRHRQFTQLGELLSNSPLYLDSIDVTKYPIRQLFRNDLNLATISE